MHFLSFSLLSALGRILALEVTYLAASLPSAMSWGFLGLVAGSLEYEMSHYLAHMLVEG